MLNIKLKVQLNVRNYVVLKFLPNNGFLKFVCFPCNVVIPMAVIDIPIRLAVAVLCFLTSLIELEYTKLP